MDELQALIDALTTNRDNPPAQAPDPSALFSGIEDDTLLSMEMTAQDAAAALQAGRLTDDTVAQLEVLADTCAAIRAEIDRRESVDASLAARAAELAARINPGAVAAAEATEEEDPEPEPVAAAAAPEITPAPVAAPAGVAVATRTRPRVDLSTLRRGAAAPGSTPVRTSASPTLTITSAADLPGYAVGTRITNVGELSRAVSARFGSFPIGSSNVEMRGGIAMIQRNFPSDLVASGQKGTDEDMLAYAADERRLPGGSLANSVLLRNAQQPGSNNNQQLDSLVAALSPNATLPGAINSVWCAPYDIDTTLCDPLETGDGFIDLPTVGVRPPGVIYTQGLDWWRLFDFGTLVESDDPCFTKPSISMPCPEWTQADVTIEPFMIESCILKERAFQSWYDLFVRRSLLAFRRWQNVQVLEKVLALIAAQPGTNVVDFSVAPPATPTPFGTAHTTLDSLSLLATWYRDLYRMNRNSTMEVVAPHWLRNVLRDDLAKRFGCGCNDVTDAQIDSWFANRGLRVQYIYDWQSLVATADLAPATGNVPGTNPPVAKQIAVFPLAPGTPPPPSGVPTPIKSYPTTFEVLLFPAGTFVSGRVEMFRMDGLYDAANLKQNKYTKIMFEDGVTVMQRCFRALRAKLPVCTNGGNFFTSSQPTNEPCGSTNQLIEAPA